MEIFKGTDNAIRSAKIEVGSNETSQKYLARPVNLLVLLEVSSQVYKASPAQAPAHNPPQSVNPGITCARHHGAVIGEMLPRDRS